MGLIRWTQAEVCDAAGGLQAIGGGPHTLSVTHHLGVVAGDVTVRAVVVGGVSEQLVALVGLGVVDGGRGATGAGDALGGAVTPITARQALSGLWANQSVAVEKAEKIRKLAKGVRFEYNLI